MAERAGVAVPAIRQVVKTADESALLVMDQVIGASLGQIPGPDISDTMLRELWQQVDRLHRARIAHRSLRAANIVVDRPCRPWVVDFSFSELGAIEAALIAGLTGVGMPAGPAVSAVLLHRLATYWLPVAPGWLSWRVLQRREYV